MDIGRLSSAMSRGEENRDRENVPSFWKLNPVVIAATTSTAEAIEGTEAE